MIRTFFVILTLWALLASPGLCLAGLIEHICADAPEDEVACGHEEACSEDPCLDALVRPENERGSGNATMAAARQSTSIRIDLVSNDATLISIVPLPHGRPLPLHESDLPLLR